MSTTRLIHRYFSLQNCEIIKSILVKQINTPNFEDKLQQYFGDKNKKVLVSNFQEKKQYDKSAT